MSLLSVNVALPPREVSWKGTPRATSRNPRDPERRLRVGYVSADFYNHPAAVSFMPALRNLDPDAFEATVKGFNAAVQPGTFDDTILDDCRTQGLKPDKTHWARRLEIAPFYAYPVRPGITFTYLATRVNKETRMLMKDGRPSANMFGAGEIMAGNVLGRGYAAGMGMTIGSVFGRIAGKEAAANARN